MNRSKYIEGVQRPSFIKPGQVWVNLNAGAVPQAIQTRYLVDEDLWLLTDGGYLTERHILEYFQRVGTIREAA